MVKVVGILFENNILGTFENIWRTSVRVLTVREKIELGVGTYKINFPNVLTILNYIVIFYDLTTCNALKVPYLYYCMIIYYETCMKKKFFFVLLYRLIHGRRYLCSRGSRCSPRRRSFERLRVRNRRSIGGPSLSCVLGRVGLSGCGDSGLVLCCGG